MLKVREFVTFSLVSLIQGVSSCIIIKFNVLSVGLTGRSQLIFAITSVGLLSSIIKFGSNLNIISLLKENKVDNVELRFLSFTVISSLFLGSICIFFMLAPKHSLIADFSIDSIVFYSIATHISSSCLLLINSYYSKRENVVISFAQSVTLLIATIGLNALHPASIDANLNAYSISLLIPIIVYFSRNDIDTLPNLITYIFKKPLESLNVCSTQSLLLSVTKEVASRSKLIIPSFFLASSEYAIFSLLVSIGDMVFRFVEPILTIQVRQELANKSLYKTIRQQSLTSNTLFVFICLLPVTITASIALQAYMAKGGIHADLIITSIYIIGLSFFSAWRLLSNMLLIYGKYRLNILTYFVYITIFCLLCIFSSTVLEVVVATLLSSLILLFIVIACRSINYSHAQNVI